MSKNCNRIYDFHVDILKVFPLKKKKNTNPLDGDLLITYIGVLRLLTLGSISVHRLAVNRMYLK